MSRERIVLRRSNLGFGVSDLGTTGLRAVSAIEGVADARIERESDDTVDISYAWTGERPFDQTSEHLARYYLERVDWK